MFLNKTHSRLQKTKKIQKKNIKFRNRYFRDIFEMRITWQTFPKLLIVLPLLHFYLAHCVKAESEVLKRRKESGRLTN